MENKTLSQQLSAIVKHLSDLSETASRIEIKLLQLFQEKQSFVATPITSEDYD